MVASRAQIFVFTAGDSEARAHLRASIENAIPTESAIATFPAAAHEEVQRIAGEHGLYAWGAIPGRQNVSRWKQMKQGDWVLCVFGATYHFAARVIQKHENEAFARAVWGQDPQGRTWSLMYFLTRPRKIQIPVSTLSNHLNAAYLGFSRIGDERLGRIEEEFGSVDAFMQKSLLGPLPTAYFLIRSNEGSRYHDELGVRYHFTDQVPNSRRIAGGGYVVADRKTGDGTRIVGFGELGPSEPVPKDGTDGPKEFYAKFVSWTPFDPPQEISQDVLTKLRSLPGYNAQHAIRPISEAVFKMLTRKAAGPIRADLSAVVDSFSHELSQSYVNFGRDQQALVRAFVASLAAKPLVILTGLSGSGKTQLAIRFGEWLGDGRMYVAAVRPDWTGAEALFGYEDALKPSRNGSPAWTVPAPLEFVLRAAADKDNPYLLLLDEMNLAHVERYFADVLSGMESGQPCLPNLTCEADGYWRRSPNEPAWIPFPTNLFIVGTVNVDETTYMFSPKVLDRANSFEFRVQTSDLEQGYRKPVHCNPGDESLVRGFLEISRDHEWHLRNPYSEQAELEQSLRLFHQLLERHGYEFGHRVFYETIRFAAMHERAGEGSLNAILDRIVMQKLLPRLHGSRRRLELPLVALAQHCFDLPNILIADPDALKFVIDDKEPRDAALPLSFDKLKRMLRSLRANQFTSFTE